MLHVDSGGKMLHVGMILGKDMLHVGVILLGKSCYM